MLTPIVCSHSIARHFGKGLNDRDSGIVNQQIQRFCSDLRDQIFHSGGRGQIMNE